MRRGLSAHLSFLGVAAAFGVAAAIVPSAKNPDTRPGTFAGDDPARPAVSAIVAAWNEAANIDAHIRSFFGMSYPNCELVICAGGSDDTYERARRYSHPRVRVIEQIPGEGKQRALARCLPHATGEIIYFTDADCRFDEDALRQLVEPIISGRERAVTGTSHPLESQVNSILAHHIWARDLAAAARNGEYIDGILGRHAAVARSAINAIGGLDFEAPTGTDYHLAKRLQSAGIRIRYLPHSSIASSYPTTFDEYRRKQSRWLRNLILFGPKFDARNDVIATWKTIGLGLVMTGLPVVGLLLHRIFLLIWAVLIIYASTVRVRQAASASREATQPFPSRYVVMAPALAMIDFFVTALPLFDLLSERRRKAW